MKDTNYVMFYEAENGYILNVHTDTSDVPEAQYVFKTPEEMFVVVKELLTKEENTSG